VLDELHQRPVHGVGHPLRYDHADPAEERAMFACLDGILCEFPRVGRVVIGQDRMIRYAEVNPDYTHRPEPADMLPALRSQSVRAA